MRSEEIETKYSFSKVDQKAFSICLLRPAAFEFLSGYIGDTRWTFDKKYSVGSYEEKYGVLPNTLTPGGNRLLLTYAEWLHFANLTIDLTLPDQLSDLLR